MESKTLPVLSCEVPGVLKLDKGAAMYLINGAPIPFNRVKASFTFFETDENGKVIPDPDNEGEPLTRTVTDHFQSFKIEVIKEPSQ